MACYTEPTEEEIYKLYERRLRHDSPTANAFCELCQKLEQDGLYLTPKAEVWWE